MNKFGLNFLQRTKYLSNNFLNRTYAVSSEDLEKIKKFKEEKAKIFGTNRRTINLLKDEFSRYRKGQFYPPEPKVPHYSEYVIIGGGIMGSSIAYALKNRAPDSFEVTVIERDPKYTRSSSALAVGGIHQQFSLEENIKLSLYSAEFLRNVKQHLSVLDDDPPDIQFQPQGYLFLADEEGAEQMLRNHKLQREMGAKVDVLKPNHLKQKFPWLNVDGIAMGSYGFENEGWFDPWALLSAFKKKSCSLGAKYVNGEVIGFEFENHSDARGVDAKPLYRANYAYVKDEVGDIHCIEFGFLVVAAGPYSNEIAKLLNIGSGEGILSEPLPIEPRKRYVYVFNCPTGPGINMPLLVDPSGTFIRREGLGGKYICGRSPSPNEEPDVTNLEVDYNFFDSNVWPHVAKRIPVFDNIQVSSAWAGYYDYNTFDQNVIFGPHPYYDNIFFASGFSGHGMQMAPAVGRAMMELLIDKTYITIDLQRFHLNRIFKKLPLYEQQIVCQ